MNNRILTTSEILDVAMQSATVNTPCACASRPLPGWESASSTFPDEQLECVGKISAQMDGELTVEEYHPEGTHLWSPNAPIALHYYPANRCHVWRCKVCQRAYLRYTEFGGYYVDRRIRSLDPALIRLEEPTTGR